MSQLAARPMPRKPKTDPRSRWPGLSQTMADAADQVMRGIYPNPNRIFTRPVIYHHRVDIQATAGSAINLNNRFFNVSPSDFICNLPDNAKLPNDMFMKLVGVRIVPEIGKTGAASAAVDADGALATSAAATNTVVPLLEIIRQIMEGGKVSLRIGDKDLIKDCYGLTRFPQGPGLSVDGALATNSATTLAMQIALLRNGGPGDQFFPVAPAFGILPGKTIDGRVDFQTAITGPANAILTLRMELVGVVISAANG